MTSTSGESVRASSFTGLAVGENWNRGRTQMGG